MRRSPAWITAAVLLFLALLAIVVRLAWVSDDACITLRTVENWLGGHGLRWNVAERVQTYTHPLWMLLLTGARLVTGEPYYGTLVLGGVLSMAAAALLMRLAGTWAGACAVAAALIASRGFGDYATSGLENPLTFVLLALFAGVLTGALPPRRRLSLLALLTGLAMTTRMDLAALCAPGLLVAMRGLPLRDGLWRVAAGVAPFLLWSLFAAVYYGTPFPITAYAKAFDTGVPAGDLLVQGLHYVVYVATHDTPTFVVVVAGIGLGLANKALRCRALAIGALLYCGYIVKVGGDFMGSRFATVPFVVAVAILARQLRAFAAAGEGRVRVVEASGVTIAAATVLMWVPALTSAGAPPWLHGPAADQPPQTAYHGIVDERRFYYEQLGLLSPTFRPVRPNQLSIDLRRVIGRDEPVFKQWGQVGRYGLEAGPLVHLVDPWLCDPLLMRLPIGAGKWRIGHFVRDVPTGYFETLAHGDNRLHHAGLRRYYDALRAVVRAPVFDGDRWGAVWAMWTGRYEADRRAYVDDDYRSPPRVEVAAADLADPVPPPTWWFDSPRVRVVYRGGLAVKFAAPVTATRARAWLHDTDLEYALTFCRAGEPVGRTAISSTAPDHQGLPEYAVDVPATVGEFDEIRIDVRGLSSDKVAAIGGLVVE